MISNRWIEQRQGLWQRRTASLVQTEQSGLKSLSGDELRELGCSTGRWPRICPRYAAIAGRRTQEQPLNLLLARAHNRVYSGRKLEARQIVRFFAVDYPRIFRRMFPYVAASVAGFLAGAALGTLLSVARPAFERMILGPAMVASIEKHQMWTHSLVSMKPQASTRHHDEQHRRGVHDVRRRNHGWTRDPLRVVLQRHGTGRRASTACAQARMALDLWSFVARRTASAGAAEVLHRRGRGPSHCHGHAVSRHR